MRNKKKIIRAVTVPRSIGFFKEIIQKMKIEGYESVVVTSPGKELDDFRKECPEFKAIAVPMERHISLLKDIVSLVRMICVLIKERPYAIHSMTPKAGLICMTAAWITRIPYRIHTFTGLVWPTATGNKRKILMLTDKILCACATHIIPEGEGVKSDLQTYITKKPMKVLGYGNVRGVDMERFDPKRFQVSEFQNVSSGDYEVSVDTSLTFNLNTLTLQKEMPFTFLFVGRIVGDKGINELVEAFTKLHDKYPKTKLVLVGRYETELDPVSELTQERIEANKSIVLAGEKFSDELLKEYVKADCFVMPSYREGFPNTVLEAGAMGLPQVVTDINGSREIVCGTSELRNIETSELRNEKMKICKNGIIVPSKDTDSLYQAMELMLTNDELRNNMASNARPMIESRFEKSYVQSCQIEFYKNLLK